MNKNLDLQSWHEVPSIAHFCSLFREAFKLFEFDIQELEESLLLLGTEDDCDQLVFQLVISLLQGCLPSFKKRINKENFNKYLRQFLLTKKEEAEEENQEYYFDNPFAEDEEAERNFSELELRDKVRVLHHLCELRLDAPDVGERVKNLEGASLRVEPLGVDSEGTTLWYFYGTRLYKEEKSLGGDKSEKKRRKKHKKLKKKRRKKSRESLECESVGSSEDESESHWSVACSTEEDWDDLVSFYRKSDRKEDRKLYKLLGDCFLPEIREMFVEKKREEKKKMQHQLSRRSSSRVEVLKKQQEDRDRQLAEQLANEVKKSKSNDREKRGRKRGRKSNTRNSDEEEDEDEIQEDAESGLDEDEDIQEDGDREERAKQREMMKEMRARRDAEKMVETRFRDEVQQQRANVKQVDKKAKKARKEPPQDSARKPNKSVKFATDSEEDTAASQSSLEPSSREASPGSEGDSDEAYKPPREYKSGGGQRTAFSNALIRAGTKSTKDSSLEKEKQKSIKEILSEKPVVRKTPGLLLQSAGKGLLNKTKEVAKEDNKEDKPMLSRGSSGISFGLWGGHLPVEPSIITTSLSSAYDDKPFTNLSKDKKEEATKKVFSNWGGDFFKKNLDYRANTNRILEKLSKSVNDVNGSTNGSKPSNGVS